MTTSIQTSDGLKRGDSCFWVTGYKFRPATFVDSYDFPAVKIRTGDEKVWTLKPEEVVGEGGKIKLLQKKFNEENSALVQLVAEGVESKARAARELKIKYSTVLRLFKLANTLGIPLELTPKTRKI